MRLRSGGWMPPSSLVRLSASTSSEGSYLSPSAWDAFKLTSIVLDMATPIIVALGQAAVVGELRRPVQVVSG